MPYPQGADWGMGVEKLAGVLEWAGSCSVLGKRLPSGKALLRAMEVAGGGRLSMGTTCNTIISYQSISWLLCLGSSFLLQNTPEKAMEDSPSACASATHEEDLHRVLGSWLQAGSDLVIEANQE